MIEERARELRATVEYMSIGLDDEMALHNKELFPAWVEDKAYVIDDRVRYGNNLYRCLQNHTSTAVWNPAEAISLWARVLIPDPEVIPDWIQPESTNPYMKGDKVRHNGKVWISDIDYNVYEPGIAGWSEVS